MAQDEYDIECEIGGLEIDVCKMEERPVRNILKGTAPYTHEPPASRSRTVRRGLAIFAAGVIWGFARDCRACWTSRKRRCRMWTSDNRSWRWIGR
jgi:hypothetical protein